MILKGINNVQYVTTKELGRGGEGTVYELQASNDLVLKKYNAPLPQEKINKLLQMIAMRSAAIEAYAAWPVDLVSDDTGTVCGFVMKRLIGYVPMHMIFSPMDRKKMFPDKGYNFLVHVARNLATAFYKLHEAGLIIGDVNEGNILISAAGLVAFIDCDSFQVRGERGFFFCEVGVPRYTPPELLARGSFENVIRTANTDGFSLAILIFQLLFMGRHPFAGKNKTAADIDEETAIRQRQFAYSLENKRKKLTPPNDSFPITNLPEPIIALFHRAFEQDSRPQATEWIKVLDSLLGDMITCNVSRLHTYPLKLQECPWCYYKNKRGILYFLDDSHMHSKAATGDIESFVNGFDLKRLEIKKWNRSPANLNLTATAVDKKFRKYKSGILWMIVICVGLCIGLCMLNEWFLVPGILLCIAIYGYSPYALKIKAELKRRMIEFNTLSENLEYLRREHDNPPDLNVYNDALNKLNRLVSEFRNLPQEFERRKRQMEERVYNEQLDEFLKKFEIEEYTIPSFGPLKKAALYLGGIRTASDIPRLQTVKIPGIGQKNVQLLYDWRRQIENLFLYVPDTKKMAAGLLLVNGEVANSRTRLETLIRKEYQSLNFLKLNIMNRSSILEKQLNDLSVRTFQAELDLVVFRKFAA